MAALVRPSTPIAQPAPATPSTPQTGTWRHPRLDEIVRRRDASTFSERNVKKIMWNVSGLGGMWFVGRLLWNRFVQVLKSLRMELTGFTAFQAFSSLAKPFTHTRITSTTCAKSYLYTMLLWLSCPSFEQRTRSRTSLSHRPNESSLDSHPALHHRLLGQATLHLRDTQELRLR
jgi:hypothetical protein